MEKIDNSWIKNLTVSELMFYIENEQISVKSNGKDEWTVLKSFMPYVAQIFYNQYPAMLTIPVYRWVYKKGQDIQITDDYYANAKELIEARSKTNNVVEPLEAIQSTKQMVEYKTYIENKMLKVAGV